MRARIERLIYTCELPSLCWPSLTHMLFKPCFIRFSLACSGVCGYNGYIPSSESIPIPTKEGPSSRAGPNSNKERAQPQWAFPEQVESLSTYQTSISHATIAKRRPATAPIFSPPRGPMSPDNEDDVILESQVSHLFPPPHTLLPNLSRIHSHIK